MFVKDFENSVHNVLDEDSERLTILQQLLSVDVRRHMARHLHDPALYQQAWNMLETRYGNHNCGSISRRERCTTAVEGLRYRSLSNFFAELNGIVVNLTLVKDHNEVERVGNGQSQRCRRDSQKIGPDTYTAYNQ